ncbi:MAG: VacJ family lipoprotein [Pseudomonadota bacterium]
MPHASLMMMTSPLLVGGAPAVATPQLELAALEIASNTPVLTAEAPLSTSQSLLALSWALTQQQSGPPEGDSADQGDAAGDDSSAQDEAEDNEILVSGEYGPVESSTMGAINETAFRITSQVDDAIVAPLAYGYRDGLPDPLRDGVGNFVRNLREPANFLNYLLQFKFGDAFETLGRFAINTTIGLGGLFDVAEREGLDLPYRQNGFANTLGYYGVGNKPYLFLPITGPTTPRDLIGNTLDQLLLPTLIGEPYTSPEYAIPLFVLANLDSRLELDEEISRVGDTVDPYATRRDIYLWRRERDIALLKGEEPPPPPAVLREIEEGLDAVEADEDAEEGIEPSDAPAIMEDPPQASYREALDMRNLAAAVTITRPNSPAITEPFEEPRRR